MGSSQNQTYDTLLLMEDGAAARTATGVGQVDGADGDRDLGGGGYWGQNADKNGDGGAAELGDAEVIIDVIAADDADADETYQVVMEISEDDTFASVVNIVVVDIAAGEAGTRHVRRVNNEDNGTVYRYARVRHILGGTTPSLQYVARLAKH